MGVEPENIERALRGKRTLPEPGGEPVTGEEGGERKRSSASPEVQPGADFGEGYEGPGGQKYKPDEERRFQARGGRRNAASEERP